MGNEESENIEFSYDDNINQFINIRDRFLGSIKNPERRNSILAKAAANGLTLSEDNINKIQALLIPSTLDTLSSIASQNPFNEIATTLLVLIEALEKEKPIKVQSNITMLSSIICNQVNIKLLRAFFDDLLASSHHIYYEHLGFVENKEDYYSREEVEKIIDYNNSLPSIAKDYIKEQSLPYFVTSLVEAYKEIGVFDDTTKYLRTNEAVFIYDVLEGLGALPIILDEYSDNIYSEPSNQIKYQRIKEYLRTIERRDSKARE